MPDLVALIEAMPAEQRIGALAALDAISRPLTVREIERMLRDHWVSKSQATKLACALQRFNIIAVVGPEGRGTEILENLTKRTPSPSRIKHTPCPRSSHARRT